jgi:hypothetical protein
VDRNGIHDRVNGQLSTATGIFAAGTPYSARDGRLIVWVHATLGESLILTYEELIGPMTAQEKDDYAADSAWLARELGGPGDIEPTNAAGVAAFMQEMRALGEICVGDDARRMAAALPGAEDHRGGAGVLGQRADHDRDVAGRPAPGLRVRMRRSTCAGGFSRRRRSFAERGACCLGSPANGRRRAGSE